MNIPFYHPEGRPFKPLARIAITKIRDNASPTIRHPFLSRIKEIIWLK
jgi:hypothetical protein